MATPQEVIKLFMESWDNTSKSGVAALNEAVRYASDNKYYSISEVVDELIANLEATGDAKTFLKIYCDIDLDNKDTGAITGYDAGGSKTQKTAESIVPENGISVYPDSNEYEYNGLKIIFPNASALTEDQKTVVKGLYSWWMSSSLDLIEESFGLSFSEAGTTVNTIDLNFEDNSSSSTLAYVSFTSVSGECTKLSLTVNMGHFKNLSSSNVNGSSNGGTSFYLDRVLAHEFTHAVMAANIKYFAKSYDFITEGAAELVHGIDDERYYSILTLAGSPSTLEKQLSTGDTNYTGIYSYSGGYIFWRYLAKQASDKATEIITEGMPEGLGVLAYKDLIVTDDYREYYVLLDSLKNIEAARGVTTINAASVNNAVALVGRSDKACTIIGGAGHTEMLGTYYGNDVLTGGSGDTVFWYGNGYGNDKITNFKNIKDTLYLFDGIYDGHVISDNNVAIRSGAYKITLENTVGQKIHIKLGETDFQCIYSSDNHDNSYYYDKEVNYFAGSAKSKDTILASTGDYWVDLSSYYNVDELNANYVYDTVYLIGSNNSAMTIKGGREHTEMLGGHLNDTLVASSGETVFWFANGYGNDTIENFKSASDILYLFDGVYSGQSTSQNDVIIYNGNSSITVKEMTNKKMHILLNNQNFYCIYAGNQQDNTFKYDAQINYFVGAADKKDTITAKTGDYWVDTSNYINADVIDASTVSDEIYLIGSNNNSMTIIGGKNNHTEMLGGIKNDTLVGGSGENVFWFGSGYGNDTITQITGNDTINLFQGNLTDLGSQGEDYYFTMDNNSTLLVKGGMADGSKVKLGNTLFQYNENSEAHWIELKSPLLAQSV